GPVPAEQLRALAGRAVRRLRTAYRVGRYGLYYTPIVRKDPRHALRALDPGAGGPSFAGMVQLMLEWAYPVAIPAPRGATIPADHPLHAKLSHGESRLVVVRRGRFWYAVRPSTSRKPPGHRIKALGYRPGPVYRSGVPLTYSPTPCGVRLSVLPRAGDTIEYSVFLSGSHARTGRFAVADHLSHTTFNRPARVSLEGPYYS